MKIKIILFLTFFFIFFSILFYFHDKEINTCEISIFKKMFSDNYNNNSVACNEYLERRIDETSKGEYFFYGSKKN